MGYYFAVEKPALNQLPPKFAQVIVYKDTKFRQDWLKGFFFTDVQFT